MSVMYPQLLWWLMPFALAMGPALAYAARRSYRLSISRWGDAHLVTQLTQPPRRGSLVFKAGVLSIGFALAVVALARPYSPHGTSQVPAGTVDCVIMLDLSRSMAATDCNGKTRVSTATNAIADELLPSLAGNQVGIISYAGRATPRVFLTYEHKAVTWLVQNAFTVTSASGDGSAMGKAFELAFRFFDVDSKPTHKKVIVLFSDGGVDDDTKLDAIVAGCRKRSVELIVFGTGQTIPAAIPVSELSKEDQNLASGRFFQENGETVRTALNEQLLDQLAQACGGSYQRIIEPRDANFSRQQNELELREHVSRKELFFYPGLGFLVCLTIVALSGSRQRKNVSSF